MSCDSEDEEFKLTKEYKFLLSNIRPLIDQLEKSRDARLCLLWLSKLEQSGKWEKKYRNRILLELCKQVKTKCLKYPFSSPPPSGPLRDITFGFRRVSSWSVVDHSVKASTTDSELYTSSSLSSYSLKTVNKSGSVKYPRKTGYFCSSFKSKAQTKTGKGELELDHSECFAIQKAYHERAQSDQVVIEECQEIIKSLLSQQLKTDASPGKLKKLQAAYEKKITELIHSITMLKDENEILKGHVDDMTQNFDKIRLLENENECLKQQVLNLSAANNCLDTKLKKSEEENILTHSDLMSKLNESDKKLKESERRCKSLERKYKESFECCETEHTARKVETERQHASEIAALEALLKEKNSELTQIKEQMENQSSNYEDKIFRLQQEVLENTGLTKEKKKVKILKSKARKLEKIREHMAVLFHSQLQQILAKKDFYIATLEMQLKMYTSELKGNNLGSDLHNALVQKVSTLENQYRKLLEDSEKQSIKRRQLDLQKIHILEKKLLLSGGVLDDIDTNLTCTKQKSLISVTAIDNEENKSDFHS